MIHVAKILLPLPLYQEYYYAVSGEELRQLQLQQQQSGITQDNNFLTSLEPNITVETTVETVVAIPKVGQIVRVNFANRAVLGCVVALENLTVDNPACQHLKPILGLTEYILSESLLKFLYKTASYNVTYAGNVLKMMVPVLDYHNVQPKTMEVFRAVEDDGDIKLTPKQCQLWEYIKQHAGLSKQELLVQAGVGVGVLTTLLQKGRVVKNQVAKPTAAEQRPVINARLLELSTAQTEVLEQLLQYRNFHVSLVHGVTGSGKTEVYFHYLWQLLQETTATSGQILILLPEIVLTAQLISRFQAQFGFTPIVWHSNISGAQRRRAYREIYLGTIPVVIGTRSALFLPYRNLRAIIVDEEHESSLKQEDGSVFYHGRDMAIMRASLEDIPVLLLSATPSLESLHNAQQGKYSKYALPARFGTAVLPQIKLIDLRKDKLEKQRVIANPLQLAMQETLARHEQIMLYLNRRGYAPMVLCGECGEKLSCPNCSVALTYHRGLEQLICHHCGYICRLSSRCDKCNAEHKFKICGAGVEKVAEEVHELFPEARIELMTTDNIHNMEAATVLIERILRQEIDILIGTQMIAKGHHFPDLALVGVIEADGGLFGGDFRSLEKTYQILQQVSGRAGRGDIKGTVLIQTYNPDNAALQALAANNATEFLQIETTNRQLFALPPYGRLVAIIASAETEATAQSALQLVQQKLNHWLSELIPQVAEVFAPVPAPLLRIQKRYRYRLLLHCKQTQAIQRLQQLKPELLQWCQHLQNKGKAGLRLKVDVDPYNFI